LVQVLRALEFVESNMIFTYLVVWAESTVPKAAMSTEESEWNYRYQVAENRESPFETKAIIQDLCSHYKRTEKEFWNTGILIEQ
jgi:hypothetical protein